MIEYKQLRYDLLTASFECKEYRHPQRVMQELGYKIIGAVPQSIADQWWFTVEDYIEPLPPYLSKMTYNFDWWHNHCYRECECYKKDENCCMGGYRCVKKVGDTE